MKTPAGHHASSSGTLSGSMIVMFSLRLDLPKKMAATSAQLMPQMPHSHESRGMSKDGNWQLASVWQAFQSAGAESFGKFSSSTKDCQTFWKAASLRKLACW